MLDYRKHYKGKFPHLIDPVRAFEKKFNRNGWPFYMIADKKGTVVFHKTTIIKNDEKKILSTLEAVASGESAETADYKGVAYLEKTLERNRVKNTCEALFPSYGGRRDGKTFTCHIDDAEGDNDFCVQAGKKLIRPSEGLRDAYYGVIVPDNEGGVWSFFSALSDLDHYDIFARYHCEGEGMTAPVNLTESRDDAMHPDATMDSDGNIWVTYYRWHFMGFHSRDKEIYARYFDGKEWSKEMRLSPEDLPVYEDHTDPSIAPHPDGGVVVAWSWDMHTMKEEKYRKYQAMYHAESPTIFGRRLTAEGGVGDLLLLGSVAMDSKPELYSALDRNVWCAWNSLNRSRKGYAKSFHVSYLEPGEKDRTGQFTVDAGVRDISRPHFLEKDGKLRLVWCALDDEGAWTLRGSTFDKDAWSKPEVLSDISDPRSIVVYCDEKEDICLRIYGRHPKGESITYKTRHINF